MKKIKIALLVTSILATGSVFAGGNAGAPAALSPNVTGGTITFTGKISTTSCNVVVNGGSNGGTAITLPTVAKTQLAVDGASAGETAINMKVSACSAQTDVAAFFEAGATTLANGRLKNTATGGSAAKNVELELLDLDGSTPIKAGDVTQNATNQYTSLAANATQDLTYKVRYHATGAAVEGDVASQVVYSLMYK